MNYDINITFWPHRAAEDLKVNWQYFTVTVLLVSHHFSKSPRNMRSDSSVFRNKAADTFVLFTQHKDTDENMVRSAKYTQASE